VEFSHPWSPNSKTTNFSTRFCKIRERYKRPKNPKIEELRNQENKNSSYSASLGAEAYLEAWEI